MSVERIYGALAASTELSDYIFRMREAVGLIVAHTPAAVDTVVSNSDSAYDVILHIGTDRYAELGAAINGSAVTVTGSLGYLSGGQYVATHTGSVSLNTTSSPWRTVLRLINGGNMWSMQFWTGRGFHVRFVEIRSSIDGAIHWTGYIYFGATSSSIYDTFPTTSDYLLINNADGPMSAIYLSTGKDNVPNGTMLMVPTMIYTDQTNNLGFPTVGNQTPYSMSARTTLGIKAGDEFTVERQRFVSLGRVAVRSI